MISLIIPHVSYSTEADKMLDRCVKSLSGYDELILVLNEGIGYGKSFNRGMRMAKGDYLVCVSNDTELKKGLIQDLLNPTCITTPLVNENQTQFGCFFCYPRGLYEQIGGFDERFEGAYFEDDDLLKRWKEAGIEVKRVDTVKITHTGGVTVKALMNENELMDRNRKLFQEKWSA